MESKVPEPTKGESILRKTKLCRLCLQSGTDMINTLKDEVLVLKIKECVSIQVEPEDQYPKHVCRRCIEKIDNWQAFKTMCLNSKATLQISAQKQIEVCENVEIPLEQPSSQSEEKVTCTICGKIVLKKSLRLHLTRHTDKFKCDHCYLTFSCGSLRNSHISATHLKLKLFNCDTCGKGFATKNNLVVHLKVHSNEKLFKCDQCSYEAKTSAALKIHKSKHENGIYVCENCSKVFKSQRNLRDHRVRVHTSKHHKCDVCSRTFVLRYLLEQHKRTHTGVQPYCCHKCSRTFARSDGLKEHLLIHEARASYQCDSCQKWFKKRSVKRHVCHKGLV